MKKDTVFRLVNLAGFIANGASLVTPFTSPMHENLKNIAHVCNLASGYLACMAPGRNNKIIALASFTGCVADIKVMVGAETAGSFPNNAHCFERYLDESISMGVQFLNIIHGLDERPKKPQSIYL